jgi:hypothetical protein
MFSVEMIWSQIKQRVQVRNNTFKMKNVLELIKQSIEEVSADHWSKCVRHVIEEEDMYATLDGIQNLPLVNIQPVIIDLNETDSDDEWEEVEEEEEAGETESIAEVDVALIEVEEVGLEVEDIEQEDIVQEEALVEEAVVEAVEEPVEEAEVEEMEVLVEEAELEVVEMEVLVEGEYDKKPYRHLSDNSYQCLLCYQPFQTLAALLTHLRCHKQCSKCRKKFGGRNGAQKNKRHEPKCKGIKKFECDFCLKILPFKSRLTRHKKTCRKRPL